MTKKLFFILLLVLLPSSLLLPQFGRNKVQYKEFEWFYIQTKHFDVYFNQEGTGITEFAAQAAESAVAQIQDVFGYRISNRISLILYSSQNDFQETNVIDQSLPEGVGGFTELFKNRVVLPFTGDYAMFRHVIHHELVHAVMNDMFYGGSIQNLISNAAAVSFPLWFSEGIAEYLSLGWDTNTDMFIRDAAINEYLPDIDRLGGYFAYRGGQTVLAYIAKKYGKQKIGELVNKIKSTGSFEEGLKSAIGIPTEDLNTRWKKDIKKQFWPDVTKREDPDNFAKKLTDYKKDGGTYNTSPALSPQGDKIAFITNKDYYFDVYLMQANDGEIIKRLVKGSRTVDFEELNLLTPGMSWSPDGTKIALAAKGSGFDNIYIIDVEEEEVETLPIRFDGIGTIHWSTDGKSLTFAGHLAQQSDIFVYSFDTKDTVNLTKDIFSDSDPAWSIDCNKIYFSSDRGACLQSDTISASFRNYQVDYSQKDLYVIDLQNKGTISRLTDLPLSDERNPINTPDGKEILFVSDLNGIDNIYRKRILLEPNDSAASLVDIPAFPVTNSMNGLNQMSISEDGKKLAFSSMYEAAYNIFLMNNPLDISLKQNLEPTLYMASLLNKQKAPNDSVQIIPVLPDSASQTEPVFEFYSGQYSDSTGVYSDSVQIDFSNYVFGKTDAVYDSSYLKKKDIEVSDNLDEDGNYKINRYRINFSPDLVYANAGYSTFYGLLGTTVLQFSDVLGDHRLVGVTSLQIDLKNSDYGIGYFYLPGRMDFGIQGFHTARFVYLDRGGEVNLYRFRNYGVQVFASYPINRFDRLDFGLNFLNVSSENLDNTNMPMQKNTFLVPSIGLVHDNSLFGYTAPIDGTRYRLDLIANPFIDWKTYGFVSLLGDYRSYNQFWTDYSLVYRFSFGFSEGNNAQRFFLGGVENWINRQWSTSEIPLDSPTDFAFLTTALPMRGFNYAHQIGSRYALANVELRFPLIRYLLTGLLPLLFQDVMGTMFIDVGSAWSKNSSLQLFQENAEGKTVTKDLLIGTGVGARIYFLYFLLRFDVAWAYDWDHFSKPVFYFSLGMDF